MFVNLKDFFPSQESHSSVKKKRKGQRSQHSLVKLVRFTKTHNLNIVEPVLYINSLTELANSPLT